MRFPIARENDEVGLRCGFAPGDNVLARRRELPAAVDLVVSVGAIVVVK
jgi:hypothetical protein